MSRLKLRTKPRVCYYEPEEPSFDEYIYCDECLDFVYEYCAIHGPLLVIPDDKVPTNTVFPSYVPRATLTIPQVFLHLAPSIIPGAGLGVFSTLTLPRGVRFGPYRGRRTQDVDSMYCWQIYDYKNKPSYVVDAIDADRSNWMRYVNCSRHWKEQNLLAYQYQGKLYYRTIKIIPRFTELLVFYGSEFANALHINLSKYNSPLGYAFDTTTDFNSNKIGSITEVPCDIAKEEYEIEDYMNADQFKIIDEESYEVQNIDVDNNMVLSDEIHNNFNENSSVQVKFTGDNIHINNNDNNVDTKSEYKCHICEKTFATQKYKQRHVRGHNFNYNCEFCNFKSKSKNVFDDHVEKHTKIFKYNCQICFYKTDIKRYFMDHRRRFHNIINTVIKPSIGTNTLRQCELCNFNTYSYKRFSIHKSKHRGNIYKCDHCDYSNHSKYNLKRHIARNH